MEPREFYDKVRNRFSVLVNKYGFEPVFELEPAGSFGWSQIIFRSDKGLAQFNLIQREVDIGILLSFDTPPADNPANFDYDRKVGWHHIVIVLSGLNVAVDYDRLYNDVKETDTEGAVNHLIDNWAVELSPHWDKIVTSMGDPEFQQKVKSMDEKGKHQRILRFDQYGMGKSLAKDTAGGLLKSIPIVIGYIISLALGLYLVNIMRNVVPQNIAMIVVLVPPVLFYLLLKHLGKPRRQGS